MDRDEAQRKIKAILSEMTDEQLENRTAAITHVSGKLAELFPRLPRESRRAIAARHIAVEIKARHKP